MHGFMIRRKPGGDLAFIGGIDSEVEFRCRKVKYIAVARSSDKQIAGSYCDTLEVTNGAFFREAVYEVLGAPDFQFRVKEGDRYRLVREANAMNFVADGKQRVYMAISTKDYPEPLIFPMLNQVSDKIREQHDSEADSCGPNELDDKLKDFLVDLMKEYNDPNKINKVERLREKVGDIKETMGENINKMEENLEKTIAVKDRTEELNEKAKIFDESAKKALEQIKWRNRKMVLLVLVVLIIIFLIVYYTAFSNDDDDDNKNDDEGNKNGN